MSNTYNNLSQPYVNEPAPTKTIITNNSNTIYRLYLVDNSNPDLPLYKVSKTEITSGTTADPSAQVISTYEAVGTIPEESILTAEYVPLSYAPSFVNYCMYFKKCSSL